MQWILMSVALSEKVMFLLMLSVHFDWFTSEYKNILPIIPAGLQVEVQGDT